jgi:hypothetical protein
MKFDARWFTKSAKPAAFIAVTLAARSAGASDAGRVGMDSSSTTAGRPAPAPSSSRPVVPPAYIDDPSDQDLVRIGPPASAMHITTLFDPQAVLSLWVQHGVKVGNRVYKLRCRFDNDGRRYIHADDLNSFARLTQLAKHR